MENQILTPGIPDDQFIRSEIPMTKMEVRVISLCQLQLSKDSVLYDIGSGTGSVAIEAAKLSEKIKVYAIEQNEDAVKLIKENQAHFGISETQMKIVHAFAPDGFDRLPSPTHAFIGGTKGQLKEILLALHKKNPEVRVVMTSVTMETMAQVQEVLAGLSVQNLDISQISVSRAQKAGDYHILKAQNPVFIYSFCFNPSSELQE